MIKLLKEAFHTYQLYLATSGSLDVHHAKLGLLKWPDIAHSAISLIGAMENEDDNIDSIRTVLENDLNAALLEPIKSIFQAALTRAVSVKGNEVGIELLEATKNDVENDPVKLKDIYIERINILFGFLEKNTKNKYPKLRTQKESPVKTKEIV